MLGIRPKSPFDIEFERELGENGISLSIRERQDGRMGLPKEADGSILERGNEEHGEMERMPAAPGLELSSDAERVYLSGHKVFYRLDN